MTLQTMNYSTMSNETSNRGPAGSAATAGPQGPNTTNPTGGAPIGPYMMGQSAGLHDIGGGLPQNAVITQNASFAEPGMATVIDQFAGLGLNPGMQSLHGIPGVQFLGLDGQVYVTHGGVPMPAAMMNLPGGAAVTGGNGAIFPKNGLHWPAPGGHDINAMQQWSQMPKPVRDQIAKNFETLLAAQPEVPALDNRRASYSTTESTPATPFYGSTSRDAGARVTVFDRSSSAYTTPSPQQITSSGLIAQPKGFASIAPPIDRDLQQLLAREPAIPQAVPAVFTPQENMKTLDQSLVNQIPGNRNVYIRGLHPTTDDDLLLKYADRFGTVETSKAIIDTATGACKGFGFAKFGTVKESETCIRGFYAMGYEVGFARVTDPESFYASGLHMPSPQDLASAMDMDPFGRTTPTPSRPFGRITPTVAESQGQVAPRAVKMCGCPCDFHSNCFTNFDPWDQESFNSRLKAEGDESSTNLYISNLPKGVTETDLSAIFINCPILSAKILRDSLGNSRGVGFARFESREICDEIIEQYTGRPIGDEGLPMQIRYADTPAQKELKRITSERRQFRTNEYNVGAYGTPLVGMSPTIYSQPGWKQRGISNGSTPFPRGSLGPHVRDAKVGMGRLSSSTTAGNTPASDDGSVDEDATVHVDSPLVANGSTRSSPIKKEKD
ncbi:hypothetical protein JX265_003435 [Neoarthrinium moseri]|uniref:RRM domain-containing protein n=1 Tax=Neoarthrinium moseri TaxID=1658444 RepID=A0A9Q0AP98_9PEZI|nr:hypothetical protein JX265_003435 [Neoarthrinium moseri]